MADKPHRIILDTNIWISFLITKKISKLDYIVLSGKGVLIFSTELLSEFIEVIHRPKFQKYFSYTDIENILETIDEFGEMIRIKSSVKICRDPNDNFLLALALDSRADYLLTGDKALLELGKMEKTQIITISEFLSKLK